MESSAPFESRTTWMKKSCGFFLGYHLLLSFRCAWSSICEQSYIANEPFSIGWTKFEKTSADFIFFPFQEEKDKRSLLAFPLFTVPRSLSAYFVVRHNKFFRLKWEFSMKAYLNGKTRKLQFAQLPDCISVFNGRCQTKINFSRLRLFEREGHEKTASCFTLILKTSVYKNNMIAWIMLRSLSSCTLCTMCTSHTEISWSVVVAIYDFGKVGNLVFKYKCFWLEFVLAFHHHCLL